jgi:septum formation protein
VNSRFILASASPRRKKLLAMVLRDFEVIPSSVDEPGPDGTAPYLYAEKLAVMKAGAVAKSSQEALVIGSDTIVVLDAGILGKPTDAAEAKQMLRSLSGRTHEVISAVSLLKTESPGEITGARTFHVSTKVTFSALSDEEISAYVGTGSPMDKAGGYGIQDDLGALFVSRIEGDYYNVVGFPLHSFYTEMKVFAPGLLRIEAINR